MLKTLQKHLLKLATEIMLEKRKIKVSALFYFNPTFSLR